MKKRKYGTRNLKFRGKQKRIHEGEEDVAFLLHLYPSKIQWPLTFHHNNSMCRQRRIFITKYPSCQTYKTPSHTRRSVLLQFYETIILVKNACLSAIYIAKAEYSCKFPIKTLLIAVSTDLEGKRSCSPCALCNRSRAKRCQ